MLATAAACGRAQPSVPAGEPALESLRTPPSRIAPLLALAELTRDEALAWLEVSPAAIVDDVGYQRLAGLARVHAPARFPGQVYLRGDRVALVYVGDPAYLGQLTPDGLAIELGGEGTLVPSRAGKASVQHVHAERGVAFSVTDDRVDFVEIFAPRSHQAYLETIYLDPGPFVR